MKLEMIETVRKMDEAFLRYQVEVTPADARDLAYNLQDYNEATSKCLVALIDDIGALVPTMNFPGDNPNNGFPHHKFVIGRELSRVLYLKIVKACMPKGFEYLTLAKRLSKLAKMASADEFDVVENDSGGFTARFWWD